MVRSFWMGSPVLALALTVSALGQSTPSTPVRSGERLITVQETGKAPQSCRIVQTWRHQDGSQVYQVQSVSTGEMMTIVENGKVAVPTTTGRTGVRAVSTRIFHWGQGATQPPPGVPVPSQQVAQVKYQAPTPPSPPQMLPPPSMPAPSVPTPTVARPLPSAPPSPYTVTTTPTQRPQTVQMLPAPTAITPPAPVYHQTLPKPHESHSHPVATSHGNGHGHSAGVEHAVAEKLPPADLRVNVKAPETPTTNIQYRKPTIHQRLGKEKPIEMAKPLPPGKHGHAMPVAEKLESADLRVNVPAPKLPEPRMQEHKPTLHERMGKEKVATVEAPTPPVAAVPVKADVDLRVTMPVPPAPPVAVTTKPEPTEVRLPKVPEPPIVTMAPSAPAVPSMPVPPAPLEITTLPETVVPAPPVMSPPTIVTPPLGTASVFAAGGTPSVVPVPVAKIPEVRRPQQGVQPMVNPSIPMPPTPAMPMLNAFTPAQPTRPIPSEPYRGPEVVANAFGTGMPSLPPMPMQPGVAGVARIPMQYTPASYYQGAMPGLVAMNPRAMMQPTMAVPTSQPLATASDMPTIPQMMQMLNESDYPSQREWAAEQLGSLRWQENPTVVTALVKAAQVDPAPMVRVCCVQSLKKMQVTTLPVMNTLQELKTHDDIRVRDAATEAMSTLGSPTGTPVGR